ncbi:MAG TPA: YidB family protein, partial [Terriglobales bacterium]|nr:YidB family protein [Terriglobales bacterium]
MSIVDALTNIAERHPELNEQQHASLVQTAAEMFGNRGGLSSLVSSAESNGLGHVVQSWIGNGPNQPIAPQQVESLLGQDRLQQLAARAGIPASVTSAALARVLPALVDKLTPNGQLDHAA